MRALKTLLLLFYPIHPSQNKLPLPACSSVQLKNCGCLVVRPGNLWKLGCLALAESALDQSSK